MYTGTMALQQCSYCPALRGPGQLRPYPIADIDRVHFACDECAEKIEAMTARITARAREALEAMESKCQQP